MATQILSGSPLAKSQQNTSSPGGYTASGSQILPGSPLAVSNKQPLQANLPSAPAAKPVSQQPSIFSNVISGAEKIGGQIANTVQGLFTPSGGKALPIVKPQSPSLTLTPTQKQAVATIKPGQVLPNFIGPVQPASASAKNGKPTTNILDNIFSQPMQFLSSTEKKLANSSVAQNLSQTYQQAMKDLSHGLIAPAYAPAKENMPATTTNPGGQTAQTLSNTFNKKTVTDPMQRYGRDVADFAMSLIQGASGNLIKNPIKTIDPEQDIIKPLAEIGGQIVTFSKLGSVGDALLSKTPVAALSKIPALSFIPKLLSNVGTVATYNQLDPKTRGTIKSLVDAAEQGTLMTTIGEIGSYKISIPLAFGGWAALAKLNGADNHQALVSGILGAALETGNKATGLFDSKIKQGSAEFTPEQARAAVVGSNLENTPTGNAIMKASMDAQVQGKNIKIDMSAAKESAAAGVVKKVTNLQTPNGIRIDNISFVEKNNPETISSGENISEQKNPVSPIEKTPQENPVAGNTATPPSPTPPTTENADLASTDTQNTGGGVGQGSGEREQVSQQLDQISQHLTGNTVSEDPTDPVNQLLDITNTIKQTQNISPEVHQILSQVTTAPNFPTFSVAIHEFAKQFDNDFTKLDTAIKNGEVTQKEYETFKQSMEALSKHTSDQSTQGQESLAGNTTAVTENKETGNENISPTSGSVTQQRPGKGQPESSNFGARANVNPGEQTSNPPTETNPGLENTISHKELGDYLISLTKTSEYKNYLKINNGDVNRAIARTLEEKISAGNFPKNIMQAIYSNTPRVTDMETGESLDPMDNLRGEHMRQLLENIGTDITDSKELPPLIPAGSDQHISLEALNGTELKDLPDWDTFEATLQMQKEAGFINPSEIVKQVKEQMEKAKANQEDKNFGTALRTYFVGERDVRIAETNQIVLSAEKLVKKPIEQDALTILRDFKKRGDELPMIIDGTHPYYDAAIERFKKENPEASEKELEKFAKEILDRGKKLQDIIEKAAAPTKGMLAVDKVMTAYFKGRLEEGQKLGFLDSKISPEEYITHMLVPKEEAGKPGEKGFSPSKNKIGRYFQFAKGRAYKDIVEAYLNGVEPKTLNALDALTIYGDKHATVAATKLLIQQLKDTELGKWGTAKSKNIPEDWKPIAPESSLFKNEIPFVTQSPIDGLSEKDTAMWEGLVKKGQATIIGDNYVKADVAHQSLFAPKKVVDALMPITDGDYMNKLPLFGKSRLYQAYIKSAELGLSVFHLRALNITGLSNQGITDYMKSHLADMASPKFLEQEKNFIKAGGTSSILGRTIEAYNKTRNSSVPGKIHIPTQGELLKMVPGVKQLEGVSQYLTHQTFGVLQRKMKVTDFALKDARWIAKHPNATDAEHYDVQKALAKEVNAVYGGLQWEVLGVNKMTQSALKFLLLAPDWTFSNWFNAETAFKGGPAGMAARGFWIRAVIIGIALNQLWSLMTSRKMSDDPTKAFLGIDGAGKRVYANIGFAGAPSDMVNLLKNIGQYGLIEGTSQSLGAKGGPLVNTLIELRNNRNYLGQAIVPKGSGPLVGTARSIYELAQGMSPIPFSIKNTFGMITDKTGKYIPAEYASILLGGGTSTHVVPPGQRQVTSGAKKGQLVKASPPGAARPFWEQVTSGKLTQPKRR